MPLLLTDDTFDSYASFAPSASFEDIAPRDANPIEEFSAHEAGKDDKTTSRKICA